MYKIRADFNKPSSKQFCFKSKMPEDGFSIQPLAVTLHADFNSIFSVIQNVESMNRLVRVSSIRMTRKESESEESAPALQAAIGLHAMYDTVEVE